MTALEVGLKVYLKLDNGEETLEPEHAVEWLTGLLATNVKCAADEGDLAFYIEDYGVRVEAQS